MHLDHMKRRGIAYTFLSLTAPGACIVPDRDGARDLARHVNEFASRVAKEHPKQFGFFAALPPLTDTEGALWVHPLPERKWSEKSIERRLITLWTT